MNKAKKNTKDMQYLLDNKWAYEYNGGKKLSEDEQLNII